MLETKLVLSNFMLSFVSVTFISLKKIFTDAILFLKFSYVIFERLTVGNLETKSGWDSK